LHRGIALLRAFDINESELGVTELATRVSLNKSTAHRLLTTLEQNGLVKQNPQTGRYSLGGGILRLGEVFLQHLSIRDVAQPYMYALANETKETVALAVRDNHAVLRSCKFPHNKRFVQSVGWSANATVSYNCVGQGSLADLSAEEIARLLPEPLTRFTEKLLQNLPTLFQELDVIRRQGYAINLEEKERGENAVASGIRDFTGRSVAALGVFGPSFRLSAENLDRVGKVVRDAANEISEQLGWRVENSDLLRGATPIINTAHALRETA
jgi:DNA-binding IclR family transcriptional regulator